VIRVQLDILVDVDDRQIVQNYITDAVDTIASNLGNVTLQRWSVEPLAPFTPAYDVSDREAPGG
jgi:hypothetical protein